MTPEDAIVIIGGVAGEIHDAAEMRYDDNKELRERLNVWAFKLLEAWKTLEERDRG